MGAEGCASCSCAGRGAVDLIHFKEVGEPPTLGLPPTLAEVDPDIENALAFYRRVFKKRLNGMINVRTDGEVLFAARRVAASFWWESYGAMPVASRSE